ncbi:GntR family transcriptional regulator [Holdemania filiformis]|uniref:GntR family transcriptional regulator n=1 Tax=Holdemania filiformis TaxID=61171 RepID=UPI00242D82C3|nr:GntR family transcriptional regulator [Holdemania filiformis]
MISEANDTTQEKNVPLYMKIYEVILSRIKTGQYPENSNLPSELDFQKEFNVSRITIRRSLKDLEDAGYIIRKRGKLAKVMPLRTYSNLGEVVGFSASLKKSGGRPSSIILQFQKEPANPQVSEYLQLPLGTDIYFLKRLRLKNGRIIGVHDTYIHPAIGCLIQTEDLNENTSLYELYEALGIQIGCADEIIEARIASRQLKQELFITEDEPIMYRERITYTTDNKPIEFSQNSYRAIDYKYIVHLNNTR